MLKGITADYIFPVTSNPIKNGIVVIDDTGKIIDVLPPQQHNLSFKLETHKGIICPGFINTHCHLELSHLKGIIQEKQGMAAFIKHIISSRSSFSDQQIFSAIANAEQEMINNGIVAVGDISNNDSSFAQKLKGNLKYHTFFEVFGNDPSQADKIFEKVIQLQIELESAGSKSFIYKSHTSITPHAPYSVSSDLFKLIKAHAEQTNSLISYHNQESEAESELFINGSGAIAKLFKEMGMNTTFIPATGLNSLRSTLINFLNSNKTLLVHNTYTSKDDIAWTMNYFNGSTSNLFFCFCPNANLYIENVLPNYQAFIDAKATCTIGTDSLASNHSLSVLDELKVINKHSPEIPLQTLLTWATLNGARFLNFDNELGSIEKNKRPGLNSIMNMDLINLKITAGSKIKRLI